MKISFHVDQNYLLLHTLKSSGDNCFSSNKYANDIVALQNLAWKINKNIYHMLTGKFNIEQIIDMDIGDITLDIKNFFINIKKSKEFYNILLQTSSYAKFCENQWIKKFNYTEKIIGNLSGIVLNKNFDIYITHPNLKNGELFENNIIGWGHHEEWKNYTTIYVWHEIMHAYIPQTKVGHAVIQLLIDNELKTLLNGGTYPPFIGHKDLFKIMNKLLPYWEIYKKSKNKNIIKFIESVVYKF